MSSPQGETERGPRAPANLPIGRFLLKQGRVALGLGLPFGQTTAHQLSALGEAAGNAGISDFRLAPGHALLAVCDTTEVAERFAGAAARLGFITDAADPRLRIVACAGAPACSSGFIHTKEVAAEMAAAGMLPENGMVHVSGCAKSCAEPPLPAVTILGTPDGASILDEAGRELARVAERELPAAFQRVLESRDMGRDIKSASPVRHRTSA